MTVLPVLAATCIPILLRRRSFAALLVLLVLSGLWARSGVAVEPGAGMAATQDDAQALATRRAALQAEQLAVAHDRANLEVTRSKVASKLKALNIEQITRSMVDHADLWADAARVNLNGVAVELQSARDQAALLTDDVVRLAKIDATAPVAIGPPPTVPAQLGNRKALLELETQHVANLEASQYIAEQRVEIATQWTQELHTQYSAAQQLSDRAALGDLGKRLEKERAELLAQVSALRVTMDAVAVTAPDALLQRHALATRLQVAQEQADIKQSQIAFTLAQAQLNDGQAALGNPQMDAVTLDGALHQTTTVIEELDARAEFISSKMTVLKAQQAIVQKSLKNSGAEAKQAIVDNQSLNELFRDLGSQQKQIAFLRDKAVHQRDALTEAYAQSLKRGLLARQTLPPNFAAWAALGHEFMSLPERLWAATFTQLISSAHHTSWSGLAMVLLTIIAWGALVIRTRRFIDVKQVAPRIPKYAFLGQLQHVAVRLLRVNIAAIAVCGTLLILFALADLPQPGFGIFAILASGWLGGSIAIGLARMMLLERQADHRRSYPRLFRAWRVGILMISVLGPVILVGQFTATSTTADDFMDRLFVLVLLPVIIVILRGRKLILSPLTTSFSARRLVIADHTLVIIALALLVSALVSVVGFINLGWEIALHVGIFLAVLGIWLLLRGVLNDAFRLLRNRLPGGDYGTQSSQSLLATLMNPLHRLAQIILFAGACWVLIVWYGWTLDTPMVRDASDLINAPLLRVGVKPVTLLSITLTLLIIIAMVRIARLARELTYHWLFFKVTNSGTRHSLSVFTQYLVVLIGFLIALRVLGIDLTTLTVFAGALGVGIGFGLQNVANNFISGILLLIERPVRTGDTVTIGTSEGSVTRIGIRSLTVQTADNLEVIIPNAEVISHPFVNWTYSDTITRSLLTVRIGYQNDVPLARTIIESIVTAHPAVRRPTETRVWLDEFTDTAVQFHVQYFTDICTSSRAQVRSDVLLKVWESFHAARIRFPGVTEIVAPTPFRPTHLDEHAEAMQKLSPNIAVSST